MSEPTNDQPSYVAMLSAIAAGEGRGSELLSSWAARTSDQELARLLRLVAARSREHAAAFSRRLSELGYAPEAHYCADHEAQLEIARSDASDAVKFQRLLGYGGDAEEEDPLPELFSDTSIDIETGMLLGRYIATERDSDRRLREAYASLPQSHTQHQAVALEELYRQLDRLTRTIEELKALLER